MRKDVLAITASAVVFAFGVLLAPGAQAQAPDPRSQQSPPASLDPGMMAHGEMSGGMMGHHGMMGGRMSGQGQPGGMAMMMRMMFSLMDADGDGKLSLQEFQAAHERIFKAIDANKDGFVSFEEMQIFMRGSAPRP